MSIENERKITILHNSIGSNKQIVVKNGWVVIIEAQWKFSGDKHKSLQVDTERTFHQRYPLAML